MAIERISEMNKVAQVSYGNEIKNVQSVSAVTGATASTVKDQPTIVSVKDNGANGDTGRQTGEASSQEQLKQAVSKLNRQMSSTSCQFGIHDETNRVMIKLIDDETKEVIREFPAEETLDIIAKAWELAGLFVDKKL